MTKPDITLEPSKGVVAGMAAQIYAAYIARGAVKDGEESSWMQRSIREAVRIARTVEASTESENEPEDNPAGEAGVASSSPSSTSSAPAAEPAPVPEETPGSTAAESAGEALQDPQFEQVVAQTLGKKSEPGETQ